MSDYLKVIDVEVLTMLKPEEILDEVSKPLIRFELENGDEFMMAGVPEDIAYNISVIINDLDHSDSRLQIHDIVSELAIIERVEIDLVVPNTTVYQSTIYLIPEGFENEISYGMIPSHATLLAILNDAPIFISEQLIKQTSEL